MLADCWKFERANPGVEQKNTLIRADHVFLMFLEACSVVESTPHVPHFKGGALS